MTRNLLLVLVVSAALALTALAADVPVTRPLPAASRITYTIEAADATDFLSASLGCPTAVAHFEQGVTAEVSLYGCPKPTSAVGACALLQAFTATSAAGGVDVTNAHPYFRLDIDAAETGTVAAGTESSLTLSCSNAQI